MRTVFVNPSRKSRRRGRGRRRFSFSGKGRFRNPTAGGSLVKAYEKGLAAGAKANPSRRRRRRNAGVAPFLAQSNPLILENPRRRRRHRRNPDFSIKGMFDKVITTGGGAAIGAAANILALNKIENVWARNGARLAAAVGASILIPSSGMGAAAGGALLYPLMQEIAMNFLTPADAGGTEEGIDHLAADLEAMLEDADLSY